MASYTYNHVHASTNDTVRFYIGDTRGTNGVSTGWVFSNDEITSALAYVDSDNLAAAILLLRTRCCRESLLAGVAGTTDTTDRGAAIYNSIRSLSELQSTLTTKAELYQRFHEIVGMSGDAIP